MFILAYLLDPIYYQDQALRLNLPPTPDQFSKQTVNDLVKHLIQSACKILQNEQLRMQKGMKEDGQLLIQQLRAYMYGEAPFRNPLNNLTQHLNWWQALANDSGAQILAIVAIKLFSVSPSEICDECTASKMSAFSTAKRNGLTGANIIHMAQLQQYWTYSFNNPNYVHKAQLTIPKSQSQPSTIVLPTPTLQDLLNPVPADNVEFPPSASAKELYGATFYEGDDDESLPITFVRGVNLERLTIEALIDLANPKLIAQFQDGSAASAATNQVTNTGTQPNTASTRWSEADAQWASKGYLDW
ncbi:hypothetical protein PILCRDRAFT_1457 [Piloderma croceum F 1598]|uniref:HAT C-terminal dimerisation domain-containing protein n=1 Tax=Piloderma croceum (strain F 1598) TaxID=765440 RepID=A0A0C3GHI0_PILCF|nr:hypothetical protein PILCRDRAFT_1457 [Piloderma croceum F 1598]